jgi:hypothetical protein
MGAYSRDELKKATRKASEWFLSILKAFKAALHELSAMMSD